MKKNCLVCGRPFYGRTDKKYCSDTCRNKFHNQRYRPQHNFIRNINNALTRNREVLEKFDSQGHDKISKDLILLEGFDFNYHTSSYSNHEGKTFVFCYDYGYVEINKNLLQLVKQEL